MIFHAFPRYQYEIDTNYLRHSAYYTFPRQVEFEEFRMSSKTQSLQSVSVISQQESETSVNISLINKSEKEKPKMSITVPKVTNVQALFIKNWITMKRNILLLLFVFFLPGIVLLINSLTVGRSPQELPLALVNLETDCSDPYFVENCEAAMLSCYFSYALNRSEAIRQTDIDTCCRVLALAYNNLLVLVGWTKVANARHRYSLARSAWSRTRSRPWRGRTPAPPG